MDFKIIWTDLAVIDLQSVVEFVAADNPEAARTLGEDIIGPVYPKRSGSKIHEIICRKRYRIFYRVVEDANRVEILRIWHAARDEPKL